MDNERVTTTVLKEDLRRIIDRVRAGESFTVIRYAEPIAVIIPMAEYLEIEAQLTRLAAIDRKRAEKRRAVSDEIGKRIQAE